MRAAAQARDARQLIANRQFALRDLTPDRINDLPGERSGVAGRDGNR
jgi:hypothetical protein